MKKDQGKITDDFGDKTQIPRIEHDLETTLLHTVAQIPKLFAPLIKTQYQIVFFKNYFDIIKESVYFSNEIPTPPSLPRQPTHSFVLPICTIVQLHLINKIHQTLNL